MNYRRWRNEQIGCGIAKHVVNEVQYNLRFYWIYFNKVLDYQDDSIYQCNGILIVQVPCDNLFSIRVSVPPLGSATWLMMFCRSQWIVYNLCQTISESQSGLTVGVPLNNITWCNNSHLDISPFPVTRKRLRYISVLQKPVCVFLLCITWHEVNYLFSGPLFSCNFRAEWKVNYSRATRCLSESPALCFFLCWIIFLLNVMV